MNLMKPVGAAAVLVPRGKNKKIVKKSGVFTPDFLTMIQTKILYFYKNELIAATKQYRFQRIQGK